MSFGCHFYLSNYYVCGRRLKQRVSFLNIRFEVVQCPPSWAVSGRASVIYIKKTEKKSKYGVFTGLWCLHTALSPMSSGCEP